MTRIEDFSEPAAREVHPKENLCGSDATCSTDAASTEPSLREESDSDDDAPVCARCRLICEGSWFLCDDKVFCSKDCRSGNKKPAKPRITSTTQSPSAATPVMWTDPRIATLSPSALELNNLLASAG